jgi:hypothetical protein
MPTKTVLRDNPSNQICVVASRTCERYKLISSRGRDGLLRHGSKPEQVPEFDTIAVVYVIHYRSV